MIVLSNCLSDKTDEGCLKVANSLIRRIKRKIPETTIVAYGEARGQGDLYLSVNKLMLSPKLLWLIWKKKEPLLYVPAVAKAHSMAVRVMVLSLAARRGIRMISAMQYQTGWLSGLLMKLSGVQIINLSRSSREYYAAIVGDRSRYLRAGVDTVRFHPVSDGEKAALKSKYGLPQDKPVVLHVGHMKAGRNIKQLMKMDDRFHAVLVSSTYASDQQDTQLREELLRKANFTLIEGYIPRIEEIYQLSDVYLFPVTASHNCIDIPLSALEAAACGLPVVTTPYGEMKELLGREGFYKLESFEPEKLNQLLARAYDERKNPRANVLEYDWDKAVDRLTGF